MISNISGRGPSSKEVRSEITPPEEHRFEFVDVEMANFKPLEITIRPIIPAPAIHPPNLHHIQLRVNKPEETP